MDFVRIEHDGPVSTVTIDRPDKLNALDEQVLGELREAFARVHARAETRCAILTGAGKAFVAGADIAAMRSMDPQAARRFARLGHETLYAIERGPVPVIAAVGGFALGGGCELMLACDFAYASERAKFGQPEVKLGVVPGFGGTQRLARRVGIARARQIVLTGDIFDAAEALRIGLVNAVVPHEELLPTVRRLASDIASRGPLAVQAARRAMADGEDLPLERANALEIEAFAGCFATEDQKEGMAAFLEKRTPSFRAC